jgi:hypothetical protein
VGGVWGVAEAGGARGAGGAKGRVEKEGVTVRSAPRRVRRPEQRARGAQAGEGAGGEGAGGGG